MTTKNPATNSPHRPRFTLHAMDYQVDAATAEDVVELIAAIRSRFGFNVRRPANASEPANVVPQKEGQLQITARADGSLVCPEHRVAATAEDRERGCLVCRFCGRTLGPVGGRMSAAPLLPEHLSGPLAYASRGLAIPREALHRLKQAGCVLLHPDDVPASGAAGEADEPAPANAVPPQVDADLGVLPTGKPGPAAERKTQAVNLLMTTPEEKKYLAAELANMQQALDEKLAAADKSDNISSDEKHAEPESAADYPAGVADKSSAISSPSPEPEKAPAPAAPTEEIKSAVEPERPRPALVPVRVRKPAKPPAAAETKAPPAPAAPPASLIARRPVRDARLVDTAGSPTSREAAVFKQMRQDLGVPVSMVAEVSSLMLREMSAIESGELSPKPGTEKEFWAAMRTNLNQANRKWCEPRPVPPQGEPVSAKAPKSPPRSDSRMF